MTNLQAQAPSTNLKGFLSRDRLLVGVPAVIGGVIALAFAGFAIVPVWQQVDKVQSQVNDLREQQATLPLLRNQLAVQQTNETEASNLREKLFALIAGSGSMNTFLAQLSAEGLRTGVQLDAYEPLLAVAPPATPAASATPAAPAKPGVTPVAEDPLLAPGTQKTSVLIGARGRYPQVLALLRRLESLGLLVVQKDLVLRLEDVKQGPAPAPGSTLAIAPPPPRTVLKLNVALYSKAPQSPGAKKP